MSPDAPDPLPPRHPRAWPSIVLVFVLATIVNAIAAGLTVMVIVNGLVS